MLAFSLVLIVGIVFIGGSIALFLGHKPIAAIGIVVGIFFVVVAFSMPSGQLLWKKLVAGSVRANWLIIDNSGGETMRHWIIEKSLVESSSQSDGWQFYDSDGNGPIYVSGDCFVMRINVPLEEFLSNYKELYNVPLKQKALR